MKHEFYEKDGVVIVELSGKIMGDPSDSSIMTKLYEYADRLMVKMIFDFSRVEWMNSRGLGICIGGAATLRNRGGDLKLLNPSPKVTELLEKTRMFGAFDCYVSMDAAMAAFK